MAELVLTDAFVSLDAVDLSAQVQEVRIGFTTEPQDASAMGDTTRRNVAGLKDVSVAITFKQDFAVGGVDDKLFGFYDAGSTFAVAIRPTSAAKSTTNPEFGGTGLLQEYSGPVAGAHGGLLQASATIIPGGGDWTRSTA